MDKSLLFSAYLLGATLYKLFVISDRPYVEWLMQNTDNDDLVISIRSRFILLFRRLKDTRW